MNKTIWILMAFLLPTGFSSGQGIENRQSSIAPLRAGMAWTVERLPASARILGPGTSESSDANGTAGKVIESNRIGDGFREVTQHNPDGRTEVRVIMGGWIFLPKDDGSFSMTQADEAGTNFSEKSLEGFGWLEARWLAGEAEVDGEKCLIYRSPWPPGGSESAQVPEEGDDRVVCVAVGVDDRLPRRVETPFFVDRYRFQIEPEIAPIPPAILVVIREERERGERMARRYQVPQ